MDRRILKTKAAIYSSLSALLKTKDLDKITIKELAEAAQINRKTFYTYYASVPDVIEEIETSLVDLVIEELSTQLKPNMLDSLFHFADFLTVSLADRHPYLEGFSHYKDFYSDMLLKFKKSYLPTGFCLLKKTYPNASDTKIDLLLNYVLYGVIGIYTSWLTEENTYDVQTISSHVSLFVTNSLELLK